MWGAEVDVIVGDLRNPASLTSACAGIGKIVFVAGSSGMASRDTPREIEGDAIATIVAAIGPGAIERFVLLSSAAVTQPEHPHNCSYNSVLKWKLRGEDALRASGLPYTIVRALGLRDRVAGEQGVRIVQGDRIAFGEDIARGDLAGFLADIVAPELCSRFAPGIDPASLQGATFEVFNDDRLTGRVWASSLAILTPDVALPAKCRP